MRTTKELLNVLTGIIISEKDVKTEKEIANHILWFLFEEDNLVVPPKQDFDLRLKMFNDFCKWHKTTEYKEIKQSHFKEWLDSL